MHSNSATMSLVIGLTGVGVALVTAGAWLYRRSQVGGALSGPEEETIVEAGNTFIHPD